jgi:hypothetical protein
MKRETLFALVAVVLVLFAAWWFRWEVHVMHRGDGLPATAYALDHWTGTIYWVRGDGMEPVTKP